MTKEKNRLEDHPPEDVEKIPPITSVTLTPKDIAERYHLDPSTVRSLIRGGAFPNAYRDYSEKKPRWRVPITDLDGFSPRKKGRDRIAAPTVGTIRWRYQMAKKCLRDSHGLSKPDFDEMIELAKDGWLNEAIAARYRVDASSVADLLAGAALLKSRPVKKPPAGKPPLKRLPEKELIELYVKSKTPIPDILKKLKTNYASLYINLRHYGIPLRDRRLRTATEKKETLLSRLAFEDHLPPSVIAARLQLTEPYVRRKINEIKRRLELTEKKKKSSPAT